jgi:hypothetical protein
MPWCCSIFVVVVGRVSLETRGNLSVDAGCELFAVAILHFESQPKQRLTVWNSMKRGFCWMHFSRFRGQIAYAIVLLLSRSQKGVCSAPVT